MDLELAAQNFLDKQAAATLTLGKALTDLLVMAREHQLALPPDLVLLFKALITADGVLHRLDPAFDIVARSNRCCNKRCCSATPPTLCASGCWPRRGGARCRRRTAANPAAVGAPPKTRAAQCRYQRQ